MYSAGQGLLFGVSEELTVDCAIALHILPDGRDMRQFCRRHRAHGEGVNEEIRTRLAAHKTGQVTNGRHVR